MSRMRQLKNLLVTGGAGFIGSTFVEHMLDSHADYKIVNLDALTYAGSLHNLNRAIINPRHSFVRGRIEDAGLVDRLMPGVDAVINFAAESHVDNSIKWPQRFIRTNIVGTQVLLDAALRHHVSLFYQVSTDEVYGALDLVSTERFTESCALRPNSPYAASKASADMLVLAYHRTYGLPVVISRCSNNYGPKQHREKFIPTVIINALKDRPVPVYGDGRYVRDWIHVVDHCRAIDFVMHKGEVGQVYNIAGANEWMNLDLVKTVLDMMDKPHSLIEFVKDRPGHDRRYSLDAPKVKELGWVPNMIFEDGLRQTIAWYQENGKRRSSIKGGAPKSR